MTRLMFVYLFFCCLFFACQVNKTPEKSLPLPSIFQAMHQAQPVEISITTDLARLTANKEEQYQPAILAFNSGGISGRLYHVEIRPRGITRRKFCSFPPLKVKFKKSELRRDSLSEINELKLVTHCQSDSLYEQLLYKEELVYQMYQQLTDRCFYTQMAQITYVDSAGRLDPFTRVGIFIESEDEVATRLSGRFMADQEELPKILDKEQYKLFVYFQYMIGNTDWNLGNRHNNGLLASTVSPDHELYVSPFPIPYDFDYCGLVNAPYAQVFESLPINSVRERLLLWRGKKNEDFSSTIQTFKTAEPKLQALILNASGLTDSIRQDALDYLNSFFPLLETPELILGTK